MHGIVSISKLEFIIHIHYEYTNICRILKGLWLRKIAANNFHNHTYCHMNLFACIHTCTKYVQYLWTVLPTNIKLKCLKNI